MRKVQQLLYDGKRLICPDHPKQILEPATSANVRGRFVVVCLAPVGPRHSCMNSAEWPSLIEMEHDLQE
jgi:hypothetical protein